ncbi:MAG: aminotransferase class V-fold PLP-dependent enzyme [Polyangiaceae bacterium]|nr:aminotransferase class V-fold PLP-dependent enzyme [Polyangiaceae bacterium]
MAVVTYQLDLPTFRNAYSRFLSAPEAQGRILLTGHSHQAWPDAARDALTRCFDDAARLVDDKWGGSVFPIIGKVGEQVLTRMGFHSTDPIAFGKSTHELVFRLLTCFRASDKPRIVTTDSEFHSLHRQTARLAEEGYNVVWVPGQPRDGLVDRLLQAITPGTAVVAFSAVMFEDAYVLPRLGEIIERANAVGAVPLVDAYHAFNVVPLDWGPAKDSVFATAGGYKYASFGEGVCWLRIPKNCTLRPVDTGWFADFAALEGPRTFQVGYGEGGARFAGATFDPSCFYRAEAALQHWEDFGLTVERLRAISTRQTTRMIERLENAGLADRIVSQRDPARRGGFVGVRTSQAEKVVHSLREQHVYTDARGQILRLGPAPYLTDEEIDTGVDRAAALLVGSLG